MPARSQPSDVTPPALLVATRSTHKLGEIRQILAPHWRGEIRSLDDAGVAASTDEDAIEVHESFRENAIAKADYFGSRTGLLTLADDSGIVVPALDGRPGVRSKRFSGRTELEGDALDRANNDALLAAMRGLTGDLRVAYYLCAAALRSPNGRTIVAIGTVTGRLLDAPKGTGGFGYDPLFYLPDAGRTFGLLDAAEKHRYSHRGRAMRAVAACLSNANG